MASLSLSDNGPEPPCSVSFRGINHELLVEDGPNTEESFQRRLFVRLAYLFRQRRVDSDAPVTNMSPNRKILISCLVIAVVSLGLGVLIGYFSRQFSSGSATKEADPSISKKIMDEIKPQNIRRHLRNLTMRPHLAGTPADLQQAREFQHFWREDVGMDQVDIVPYKVLLSYPDDKNPNVINMLDDSSNVVFHTQLFEKILRPDEKQSNVVPPFNAYSSRGNVTGDLVYVNYARAEDFDWLAANTNINVSGKIVIARYGKIFRGNKVTNAEKQGAVGVIFFSDPKDYAVDGTSNVYPDTWWLPPTGVQRGNVKRSLGDPLTPLYPAIESAYRIPEDDEEAGLPKIPVHPISYGDAMVLLSNMTGDIVPDHWKGALPITYRIGPGFKETQWKTEMKISTQNQRAKTYNVIGFIKGAIEPDRYVIIGNHRDAWVFGALDPSSGSACMLELSRAVGELVKRGWRPRRTIVFASWGAEEHGILGSTEWVENYIKSLAERTVAYLNVDIGLEGNYSMRAKGTPLMYQVLFESSKKVPNPDPSEVGKGRRTVYDTWVLRQPKLDKDGKKLDVPRVQKIGSGSDFRAFVQLGGIPSCGIRYTFDRRLKLSSYPLYHSVYETFHLVDQIMDKDYKYLTAVTRVWGEIARSLADELLLPFDVKHYSEALQDFTDNFLDSYEDKMKQNGLQRGLDFLREAVADFGKACQDFSDRLNAVNKKDPMAVRMMNDQMMQLERAFIDPNGLPGQKGNRHVLMAPSSHNSYSGSGFPGLKDLMYKIGTSGNATAQWEKVKRYLSVVIYTIDSAASTLQDVSNIHKHTSGAPKNVPLS